MLGKRYISTPRAMDELRDVLTFDTGAITSYQLGSGQTWVAGDPAGHDRIPSVAELTADVDKMKNIILVLNERVVALESGAAKDARKRRRPGQG